MWIRKVGSELKRPKPVEVHEPNFGTTPCGARVGRSPLLDFRLWRCRRPEQPAKPAADAFVCQQSNLLSVQAAHQAVTSPHVYMCVLQVLMYWRSGEVFCIAGYLADLESAAWKDDRAFRLLTVHAGVLSFSDLFFSTSGKARPGVARPQSHTVGNSSLSVAGQGSNPCFL